MTPGMLNNEHQLYQSKSAVNSDSHTLTSADPSSIPGSRQMNASPYMPMGDPTINPSNIPMQNSQIQQQRTQSINLEPANGMQSQHLQQLQPASGPVPMVANAVEKVLKPKPKSASRTGGSASSSDDDLEIEDEEPEMRPAVITIAKPDGYKDKLLWEAVDSVWTPRNKPASSEKIVAAIKFVGEAVRGLREQWKSYNEKLKKAELPNSETSLEAPQLKQLVGQLREIMEILAARVTKWGHPSILKRYVLSSHPLLTYSHRICILDITSFSREACVRLILIMICQVSLETWLPHGGLAIPASHLTSECIAAVVHSSIPCHIVVSSTNLFQHLLISF